MRGADVVTLAGGGAFYGNGDGGNGRFRKPNGVAVTSADDYVYVADTFNHRIRKVRASDGYVWTTAGDLGACPAGTCPSGSADGASGTGGFNHPMNLVITSDDATLYVADFSNNKIRKVLTSDGSVTTLAGDGSAGSVDGAAASASFNLPYGLALTSAEDYLYVTDFGGHRIRKVATANGAVTTLWTINVSTASSTLSTESYQSPSMMPDTLIHTNGEQLLLSPPNGCSQPCSHLP